MCKLENFRKNAASQSISCEIVGGHVVQSEMTGEDGHKLCFLLGTMLEDYLLNRKNTDQIFIWMRAIFFSRILQLLSRVRVTAAV